MTEQLLTDREPAEAPAPAHPAQGLGGTVFSVLLAISFCHLLNDMMQSLLPAIYPTLRDQYALSFSQLGFLSTAYQITASILQPMVGIYADKRPTPWALPTGPVFSLAGLAVL